MYITVPIPETEYQAPKFTLLLPRFISLAPLGLFSFGFPLAGSKFRKGVAFGWRTGWVGDFPNICSCGNYRASPLPQLHSVTSSHLGDGLSCSAPPTLWLTHRHNLPSQRKDSLLFCSCGCLLSTGGQEQYSQKKHISTLSGCYSLNARM